MVNVTSDPISALGVSIVFVSSRSAISHDGPTVSKKHSLLPILVAATIPVSTALVASGQ